MADRLCEIVDGGITVEDGTGDGAYNLVDVTGTPDDIGKAVAEYLKTADLWCGSKNGDYLASAAGMALYLDVRIKFCNPGFMGDGAGV
jgi:hypothetical protein